MRLLTTIAAFARPARRHTVNHMAVIAHLGGAGLFLLSVLDGSPLPTFGGPDILTAILAARNRHPWYYYAILATAGSVVGAYITFRIAHRAGSAYLQKKFGERKSAALVSYFEQWGTGALLASTLVPLPFPTSAFFAIAGVLNYPLRTFIAVVALGRAVRYTAISLFAYYYGRQFLRVLRHPGGYLGWALLIATVLAAFIAVAMLVRKRLHASGTSVLPAYELNHAITAEPEQARSTGQGKP